MQAYREATEIYTSGGKMQVSAFNKELELKMGLAPIVLHLKKLLPVFVSGIESYSMLYGFIHFFLLVQMHLKP